VALAIFVATALGACSGNGGTKEDFVAAADDACREADERIKDIGAPRVEEGILGYVEQAREISDDLVADLRALDPPEADADEVDEMIDGLEQATELLEPLAQATIDRDTEQLQELQQEVQQVTDDVSEFAESYGFEVCGAKVLDPVR
jgi:polyhydroxyalkanoate synthesis regulator phasin